MALVKPSRNLKEPAEEAELNSLGFQDGSNSELSSDLVFPKFVRILSPSVLLSKV
jgi:hypothetical protein